MIDIFDPKYFLNCMYLHGYLDIKCTYVTCVNNIWSIVGSYVVMQYYGTFLCVVAQAQATGGFSVIVPVASAMSWRSHSKRGVHGRQARRKEYLDRKYFVAQVT